ncbi:hypothetical protein O3P69_006366 [Scylla paramamosain]|uniref:Uncharacterized protein n=1 Tax=Scylla paramamosain TaxID=85552 RepID=A0AAW0U225_SCYPA
MEVEDLEGGREEEEDGEEDVYDRDRCRRLAFFHTWGSPGTSPILPSGSLRLPTFFRPPPGSHPLPSAPSVRLLTMLAKAP